MVLFKIIEENILNSNEKYICQQCNCVTKSAKGLAKSIIDKYSWANPYEDRNNNNYDTPGTIIELEYSKKDPIIICFMSQYGPSKPNKVMSYYRSIYKDTYEERKKWFQDCLDILDHNNYDTVAMPYGIGCGLAGGKWEDYENMIKKCSTKIILYRL